jgi:hypothetical protein
MAAASRSLATALWGALRERPAPPQPHHAQGHDHRRCSGFPPPRAPEISIVCAITRQRESSPRPANRLTSVSSGHVRKPPAPEVSSRLGSAQRRRLRKPERLGRAGAAAAVTLTFGLDHSVGAGHSRHLRKRFASTVTLATLS